ncbi:hypothetical protein NY08_3181 [Rhodococcus sp. B7740]|nr:hypothetical protein NY08_3181 [Rhodococcus sp. B7740]
MCSALLPGVPLARAYANRTVPLTSETIGTETSKGPVLLPGRGSGSSTEPLGI